MFLVVPDKYSYCGPNTHKQLKMQHVVNIILFILVNFLSHVVYFVYNYIEMNATSILVIIQTSATGKKDS